MNRAELIDHVRNAASLSRADAETAVEATLDAVMTATKAGERVSLFGFGTFTPSSRAARTGRNPQTGAPVKIAASQSVRFTPAAAFKASLNPKSAKKATTKKAAKPAAKASASKASAPAKKAPAAKAAKSTKKR